MRDPQIRLYHKSPENDIKSFEDACDHLFFQNSSPKNIFHLLLKYKKNNLMEKKFKIFIDLISQGADLNKELEENKSLEVELGNYFDLEKDDEEFNYFKDKALLKLGKFKNELERLPRVERLPNLREIYLKSLNYIKKISDSYHDQLKVIEPDPIAIENIFTKISKEDFFSKKQPREIENILNHLGFLSYLNDSKIIDFLYKKIEKYLEHQDAPILKEEEELYYSINKLIEVLPNFFGLKQNQKKHLERVEELKDKHTSRFLSIKNKFLSQVKAILDDKIKIKEASEKRLKKEAEKLKIAEEKARCKEEERAKRKTKEKEEKQRKKEAQELIRKKTESIILVTNILQDIFLFYFKEINKREKEKRKDEFKKNQELLKEVEERDKEKAIKESKELAKKQEIEKQIKQQQVQEIKDKILAKTSDNFEKFQSFFDHLRDIKWLEIGEVGLFGSRVYREVLNENCSSIKIPKNPRADFDFFCISGGDVSNGIFKLCHEESASRENFRGVIEEFNKKNPNLQIYFKDEEIPYAFDEIVKKDGEKSVNFLANRSLNFKLVAVILEDKKTSEDEVDEVQNCKKKTVKDFKEFDLNFYTQQSMLENLQWQFNLERVLLVQNPDRTFALKINHCNCDPSQEKMTIEKFITETQNSEQQDFLFESNPQARGFLNRMINKKGVYKYLDEETLNTLKSGLLNDNDIKENLKKELLIYKKIVDEKASGSLESKIIDEKFTQAKFIVDEIAKDKIFKEDKDFQEILRSIPRGAPTRAGIGSKPIARI